MKDEGLMSEVGCTKPEQAVGYVLRRIQLDADLRYHMIGTEAFRLLCEAQAERTGETVECIKAMYSRPSNHDLSRLTETRRAIRRAINSIKDNLLHVMHKDALQDALNDLERHAE